MATITKFEDLEVWQLARELCKEVYSLTFIEPIKSDYRLRDQMRAEFNKINSSPFIRIGKIMQKVFKGHKFAAVLPELSEDFEIKLYNDTKEISNSGTKGPFVLIAVCEKQ